MNHTTFDYQPSKRERVLKPVFGGLAVLATIATLGLAVAGPAALSPLADDTVLARRASPAPIEVAITPATIQVVATRAQVARRDTSGFVPAVYRGR